MISSPHKNIYITPSSSEAVFCFAGISFQFFLRCGPLKGYEKLGAWGVTCLKTATAQGHLSQAYSLPLLHCVANHEFLRLERDRA